MGCIKMGFDWPNMSSSYANFAGILAGFVFSGIFLLLEDEKRDASEVISILMVGFFGLLLSAFLFSNISGLSMETANPIQLRMLSFRILVASIIFSITIMQMFLSLIFIFILYRLPQQVISLGKNDLLRICLHCNHVCHSDFFCLIHRREHSVDIDSRFISDGAGFGSCSFYSQQNIQEKTGHHV